MKTKLLRNIFLSLGVMFGLAMTAHAQNLYVSSGGDEAIFEYTPLGVQSTFALLRAHPFGLAFDSKGNLFVAEDLQERPDGSFLDGRVLKFNPRNQVTTIATGNAANFLFEGLATDSAGNVFVAADDTSKKSIGPTGVTTSTIFKFTPSGDRIVFGSVPGQGLGLAFDSAGNLYAASNDFLGDSNDQTIFKFTPNGTRSVFVGPTAFAAGAYPIGLAFDSSGNLFVSTETFSGNPVDTILKFTAGVGSTFATGLTNPRGLAFDGSGNLFVAERRPFPDGDILKFPAGGGMPTVFASGLRRPNFLTFGPPR